MLTLLDRLHVRSHGNSSTKKCLGGIMSYSVAFRHVFPDNSLGEARRISIGKWQIMGSRRGNRFVAVFVSHYYCSTSIKTLATLTTSITLSMLERRRVSNNVGPTVVRCLLLSLHARCTKTRVRAVEENWSRPKRNHDKVLEVRPSISVGGTTAAVSYRAAPTTEVFFQTRHDFAPERIEDRSQ